MKQASEDLADIGGVLARCKREDRAAYREFADRFSARVYRWALFLGLGPAEAEDAAQEVLATALRRIDMCRAPEAVHAWLFQITRRIVANARRRVWVRRLVFGQSDSEAAHDDAPVGEPTREHEVRACLLRLPRQKAELLILMCVEGYTKDETASMLGIPAGTVASRLRSAKEAFAESWWGQDEVEEALCVWRKT